VVVRQRPRQLVRLRLLDVRPGRAAADVVHLRSAIAFSAEEQARILGRETRGEAGGMAEWGWEGGCRAGCLCIL
jgi:hypothetical protein